MTHPLYLSLQTRLLSQTFIPLTTSSNSVLSLVWRNCFQDVLGGTPRLLIICQLFLSVCFKYSTSFIISNTTHGDLHHQLPISREKQEKSICWPSYKVDWLQRSCWVELLKANCDQVYVLRVSLGLGEMTQKKREILKTKGKRFCNHKCFMGRERSVLWKKQHHESEQVTPGSVK